MKKKEQVKIESLAKSLYIGWQVWQMLNDGGIYPEWSSLLERRKKQFRKLAESCPKK